MLGISDKTAGLPFDFHRAALLLAVRRRWKLQRDRRAANPAHVKEQKKKYYYGNLAKSRAASLARYHKHRIRYRAMNQAYIKRRLSEDPVFRLGWTLRSRLRAAVKTNAKKGTSMALLGCPIREYRAYLQEQFKPGMTWENYGVIWHVDHKRPCASFDLASEEGQRECFNYKNTQPLFVRENLTKGKQWSPPIKPQE